MRRLALTAVLAAGCGFSIEGGSAAAPDGGSGAEPDGELQAGRRCASDPTLKLCIDFDDAVDLTSDGSTYMHAIDGQLLVPMPREGETAVHVTEESRIHVPETPVLNIESNLTVSLWTKVSAGDIPVSATEGTWLYDNNDQYYAYLRTGGFVRCGSQSINVDSRLPVADGEWHHVACTYEPTAIKVYVDGALAGCRATTPRQLPTDGDEGFAVGANLGGGRGGPDFDDQLVGGIDNIQVFARTWTGPELCADANESGCANACPP